MALSDDEIAITKNVTLLAVMLVLGICLVSGRGLLVSLGWALLTWVASIPVAFLWFWVGEWRGRR